MNDPSGPSQPFQPEVSAPAREGCGKAALIGCGGLLLILLVAVVIFLFNVKKVTAWGFGLMEQQVMARLPAETTDEEARRVRRGFAAVIAAVQDDTVDPNALQQLQPVILLFADPNNTPHPEDVDRLVELLETASRLRAPPLSEALEPEASTTVPAY